jgi:hypothetical protein
MDSVNLHSENLTISTLSKMWCLVSDAASNTIWHNVRNEIKFKIDNQLIQSSTLQIWEEIHENI